MHSKNIVVVLFGKSNGVIQILGIFSVNRDRLPAPHIFSACHVRSAYRCGNAFCLIQNLFRKFQWQVIALYNRQNIYSRVIYMTKNFDYFSLRFLLVASIRCQFHHNFASSHCPFGALCRYKNILQIAGIIRNNKTEILSCLIVANKSLRSALYYLQNLSFFSLALRCTGDGNFHLIPLHGTANIFFCDVNIFWLSFNRHEAKALHMSLKNSSQTSCLSLDILALLGNMNLSFFFQTVKNCFQFSPCFLWNLQ